MCPKIGEPFALRRRGLREANDVMRYDHDEDGGFWVGPKFGCVHWKKTKDKPGG